MHLTGCSNQVLNGINKGGQLDSWKSEQISLQELSAVELCNYGSTILTHLCEGSNTVQGLVADIFRCAAVIYINMIMSGNSFGMINCWLTFLGSFPRVREIKMALAHLVNSIKLLLLYPTALELICWPIVSGATLYCSPRRLIKGAGSLAILPTQRTILRQVYRRLEGIGDFVKA